VTDVTSDAAAAATAAAAEGESSALIVRHDAAVAPRWGVLKRHPIDLVGAIFCAKRSEWASSNMQRGLLREIRKTYHLTLSAYRSIF